MQTLPDPFVNTDPQWEPYQLNPDDFVPRDQTPSLKRFIQEAQRANLTSPKPAPDPDGAPIGHIYHYR